MLTVRINAVCPCWEVTQSIHHFVAVGNDISLVHIL